MMKFLSAIKPTLLITALVVATSTLADTPPTSAPANAATFNPQQTQAIEKIVHDYLVNNPQVLVEVADALQKQQTDKWQKTASTTIPQIANQLFAVPISPVIGNANGNVTMVEFFDYQCPHCQEMGPQIDDLIKSNKNLRVVLKALPIFGDTSQFAAVAALASQKQGKFLAFHEALLNIHMRLTDDIILQTAKQVGINTAQLQTDMQNPAIAQEIKANIDLAKKLELIGTPAFVIAKVTVDDNTHHISLLKNPMLIPGAVDESTLSAAISQVSGG